MALLRNRDRLRRLSLRTVCSQPNGRIGATACSIDLHPFPAPEVITSQFKAHTLVPLLISLPRRWLQGRTHEHV